MIQWMDCYKGIAHAVQGLVPAGLNAGMSSRRNIRTSRPFALASVHRSYLAHVVSSQIMDP